MMVIKLIFGLILVSGICYIFGAITSTSTLNLNPDQQLNNELSSHSSNLLLRQVHKLDIGKSYLDNHKGDLPSICNIATINDWHNMAWSSYGAEARMDRVPHISEVICKEEVAGTTSISNKKNYNVQVNIDNNSLRFTEEQGIIILKSARTGSTFFTEVITKIMTKTKREVSMFWEPFGSGKCIGASSAPEQENSLNSLLLENCPMTRKWNKCKPLDSCTVSKFEEKDGIHIFAANPRFFDPELDWGEVIKDVKNINVFSLRRTNLVLMSYSKFHHGGCGSGPAVEFPFKKNKRNKFSFDVMLSCVYHYTIFEQELSISSAFHVASLTDDKKEPFIAAYEDVIQNKELMEEQVLMFLGLDTNLLNDKESTSFDDTKAKKQHKESFCDNKDVDCKEIYKGFAKASRKYPCLESQLKYSDDGDTWSMPMLDDGSISIYGDCYPLPTLERETRERRFAKEFYTK